MSTISASELINAQIKAIGEDELTQMVKMSYAYYRNQQYPDYPSRSYWWDAETGESTHPRCVIPVPSVIVDQSANFLFRNAPYLKAPSPELQAFCDKVWMRNEMGSKLIALAQQGGIEGGVWLKFTKNLADKRNYIISSLSPLHVRAFYDPDDSDKLLMVRVQYCRMMPNGKYMWFREEWTEQEWISYYDVDAEQINKTGNTWRSEWTKDYNTRRKYLWTHTPDPNVKELDDPKGPWVIRERRPNKFGVIPFVLIRNKRDYGDVNGRGDYWDMLPTNDHLYPISLLDKINITANIIDRRNQMDADPPSIWKNVQSEDIPNRVLPGGSYTIQGLNAEWHQPTSPGDLQRPMLTFLNKLETLAYQAASVVNIDTSQVTGLGQMSGYALSLLYGPIVALTDIKRPNYGEYGLAKFMKLLVLGAARSGDANVSMVDINDDTTYHIECEWQPHFMVNEIDRQLALVNLGKAISLGLPLEDAVEELAKLYPPEDMTEFRKRVLAGAENAEVMRELRDLAKEAFGRINAGVTNNRTVTGGEKMSARQKVDDGDSGEPD